MNLGTKKCEQCGCTVHLKIRRDLTRKRFCSIVCKNKFIGLQRAEWFVQNIIPKASTLEANKKKSHKGSDHPNWKLDRSEISFKRLRSSFESSKWRKAIFERDNFTCQFCGRRGGKLQADHIKPWSMYPELRFDLNNGRTLCVDCHKDTDTYGIKMAHRIRKGEYDTVRQ